MPLGERGISDTFYDKARAWQGFLTLASRGRVLVDGELGKVGQGGGRGEGRSGWRLGCVLLNCGRGNKEVKKMEGGWRAAHSCNPSTRWAEARGLLLAGPRLYFIFCI